MKKLLLVCAVVLAWLPLCQAGYLDRVLKYCYDNGITNAQPQTDFLLVDNSDGTGPHIASWNLPIPQPTNEQLPSDEASANIQETVWEDSKPYGLKLLENVYVDFLTNQWTATCRSYALIPTNYTITVDNTDEATNIGLLLTLRAINFDVYDKMAGEFDRLKNGIIGLGGIMSKCKKHDL